MPNAVEDIAEKLKRADEHVEQLHGEIRTFWRETPNSIVNYDTETAKAFRDFHENRSIPPRLMVIAGEVIYQLRSSLDHLICALVLRDGGRPDIHTQFPIFEFTPTEKKDVRRYERQVKGITRPEVLAYIQRSQPFHRGDKGNRCWLAILKSLSNTDKHRALVLHVVKVKPKMRFSITPEAGDITSIRIGLDDRTETIADITTVNETLVRIVNVERKLTIGVTFAKFGDVITDMSVIKGLTFLRENTHAVVEVLSRFL